MSETSYTSRRNQLVSKLLQDPNAKRILSLYKQIGNFGDSLTIEDYPLYQEEIWNQPRLAEFFLPEEYNSDSELATNAMYVFIKKNLKPEERKLLQTYHLRAAAIQVTLRYGFVGARRTAEQRKKAAEAGAIATGKILYSSEEISFVQKCLRNKRSRVGKRTNLSWIQSQHQQHFLPRSYSAIYNLVKKARKLSFKLENS